MNYRKSIVILSVFSIFYSCSQSSEKQNDNLFSVKSDSLVSVVMTGELESVNATTISSPANWNLQFQIVYLPEEGAFVNEGDTVVIFDTKEVESRLLESQKKLEKYQQELAEVLLKNQQEINNRENEIISLEIQEKIVRNQFEMAKYNSDVDQKSAELELEKTLINLKKNKEDLDAQYVLNKNAENEVLLKINQTEIELERNKTMMNDMYLTTRKSGIIVYERQGWRKDEEKVKIGDNVRPMAPLLAIPDLNNMQAELFLNEVDLSMVQIGMPANFTIEAYPDTQFTGEVTYVSKIADREPYATQLKSYIIKVRINSKENFRLKPGLSAKIEIFTNEFKNVFSIPSWCLFSEDEQFFVQTDDGDKIKIELKYLQDGTAFVSGDLTTDFKLIGNLSISGF